MVEGSFVAPRHLDEALAECSSEGAVPLGGGAALALMLKERLVEPAKLVYLGQVAGMAGIETTDSGELRLGATATVRALTTDATVLRSAPALAHVARLVGNPRVRAVATIGGTLAHADPRQDLPPVLLALGARVRIASTTGTREVPLADFLLGFMETALDEGELVWEVIVPVEPRRRSSYQRFAPASQDDFATVGVAASVELNDDGSVAGARVALAGVGSRAFLVADAAHLVQVGRPGSDDVDHVAQAAASVATPFGDVRGSVEYKREMVRVHTRRALEACLWAETG
jgi:carbon-monoxide dehydrogenase medium subunit